MCGMLLALCDVNVRSSTSNEIGIGVNYPSVLNDFVDTIVARATPLGSGGICVVRLSGTDAVRIADTIFVREQGGGIADSPARMLVFGTVSVGGDAIDQVLAVRFPGPRSYTGEDVVELHLHGNVAIAELVISAAVNAGARVADPGEFTRRAFVNGRIDLTQVEALADLLAADSRAALAAAERGLRGVIRSKLLDLRERVLSVLARLELELDFVEEGYSFASSSEIESVLSEILLFSRSLIADFDRGELLRRHPRVLLAGRPNAGKSSFFNASVGYDRAIVSETPGTTRDYVEEDVVVDGVRLTLIDTAGLRDTDDAVEAVGVSMARELTGRVDVVLILVDTSSEDFKAALESARAFAGQLSDVRHFIVGTKADVSLNEEDAEFWGVVSVHRPESVRELLARLAVGLTGEGTGVEVLVTERQRSLCQRMVGMVEDALASELSDTVVVSSILREMLVPLSELAGASVTEDVLNAVFSQFCIGK